MPPTGKAKKGAKRTTTAKRATTAKKAKAAPRARPAARRSQPARSLSPKKERTHCIATDPFGDPCQTSPRYGSKYCSVHSHLDR